MSSKSAMAISSSSSSSRTTLDPVRFLLCLLVVSAATNQQPQHAWAASQPPVTHAGCPDKCGNISIPYPFGTEKGCFKPGFRVICNNTFHPPRAFIESNLNPTSMDRDGAATQIVIQDKSYITQEENASTNSSVRPIELVDVSVSEGKARVVGAFSYYCVGEHSASVREQEMKFANGSPFLLSDADNVLMGIGSGVNVDQSDGPICQSYIPMFYEPVNGSCSSGMGGCCWSYVPPSPTGSRVRVTIPDPRDTETAVRVYHAGRSCCSYGMIVDKSWYNFSSLDLDNDAFLLRNAARGVHVVLGFTIGEGACPDEPRRNKDFACVSSNSVCKNRSVAVPDFIDDEDSKVHYYCSCSVGYEGNPYIQDGCQDIDECARRDKYPCHGKCKNTPGDYECTCPAGKRGNAKQAPCTDLFPLLAKISIGGVGFVFIIAIMVFVALIRNEKRKMAEIFKKNGGPTLEKAKIIKIYKKEELNPILTRSNFIGRGAFGEVYKGFLDNQLVAVKKPIDGTVAQNDQFANEVIIQSQVIHKNIVKLLGCCLEVDKPMLVYEYLSKGSLDDILHGSSGDPLTLEQRLNIAAESAEGLAYMHSKTGNIILHGDVKPANILLNDSFTPKISDFGISRLIVIDKELTDHIIGDRNYMDPVYLRDGILTDKSDVYSFGVVLLELISRKKATYSDNNSLVRSFLDAHKNQKEATELFDKEIAKPEVLKILAGLYEIAVSCLNLDVDERPNMTQVETSLLKLKGDLIIGMIN